jgi:hypothetical protein
MSDNEQILVLQKKLREATAYIQLQELEIDIIIENRLEKVKRESYDRGRRHARDDFRSEPSTISPHLEERIMSEVINVIDTKLSHHRDMLGKPSNLLRPTVRVNTPYDQSDSGTAGISYDTIVTFPEIKIRLRTIQ